MNRRRVLAAAGSAALAALAGCGQSTGEDSRTRELTGVVAAKGVQGTRSDGDAPRVSVLRVDDTGVFVDDDDLRDDVGSPPVRVSESLDAELRERYGTLEYLVSLRTATADTPATYATTRAVFNALRVGQRVTVRVRDGANVTRVVRYHSGTDTTGTGTTTSTT